MVNQNNRRIVLIVPTFPKLSETFIVGKFLGLLQRGWDVHILCTSSPEAEWTHFPVLQQPGIRQRVHVNWPTHPSWLAALLYLPALVSLLILRPLPMIANIQRSWPLLRWKCFTALYLDRQLLLLKPDIIHFEFGALAAGREDLARRLGCKMAVSFRGYDLNFSGLDQPNYFDKVWQYADAVHCLGEDLWRRALQRGCPPNKPHHLIPPAVDAAYFQPPVLLPAITEREEHCPLRILSVGRLEWIKGYEYGLLAVKLLLEDGYSIEYRIVGAGSYLEPLAFTRRQLGLENSVIFLGALSPAEIKEPVRMGAGAAAPGCL